MAKHFKMLSEKNKDQSLQLQLRGDFDGTSAHELANTLSDFNGQVHCVAVDTDGLRNINAFSLDVFRVRMKMLRPTLTRIVFTGRFKVNFHKGGS